MATIEEDGKKAIYQFLSKPTPLVEACGCLGQGRLPGQEDKPWNEAKLYPICPCAMQYVEEVNGRFYRIFEDRISSPDTITFTARYLGPVGGPYLYDQYGREIKRSTS